MGWGASRNHPTLAPQLASWPVQAAAAVADLLCRPVVATCCGDLLWRPVVAVCCVCGLHRLDAGGAFGGGAGERTARRHSPQHYKPPGGAGAGAWTGAGASGSPAQVCASVGRSKLQVSGGGVRPQ